VQTRFTSLVKLKKSNMQKSERLVQQANADLNSAATALKISYDSLKDVEAPESGTMNDFLASRTLLESQRGLIRHNTEWLEYAKKQVQLAKNKLKQDTIEHEKFKYLELEEIKKELKKIKDKESKAMDEVALMTFERKKAKKSEG
jgi:flagellar biosynthesis chaperone FliJ